MMATVRVACVGAGYFSQFHYGSWARMSGVEVVGACDLDIDAARATGYVAYDDLGLMLAQTKPDVVDIILPSSGHANAVTEALLAGVKTIICQKPFCQDITEASKVVAAVESAGARIIIHENIRFMPWYRTIKAAIDAGNIGTPLQATFRLRTGDGQGPDAYLDRQPYFQKMPQFLVHETAVHWIDTFLFLFEKPLAVYADLRQINPVIKGEDAGVVLFDHPSGMRSIFDGNRHLDHSADNTRRTMGEALFEGTDGTLSLFGDGRVELRSFGSQTPVVVLGPDTWQGFGGDCVHHLQSHVIAAVQRGAPLENEAREYLEVIRIKNAIYQSAENGKKIYL